MKFWNSIMTSIKIEWRRKMADIKPRSSKEEEMASNDMATNKSQEKIKYQEIIITLQKKTVSDKCQLKRRTKYLLKMIPWLKILSEHILQGINTINRSSRTEVFCKKAVLRNSTKFTGKHLCQSLFFNKVAGLRPEEMKLQYFNNLETSKIQNLLR